MVKKKKAHEADDALLECSSCCVSICTFCTSQASKSSTSTVSLRQHLHFCAKHLYFCTSKASKLLTSTVSLTIYRFTRTGRSCPMRCTRATACLKTILKKKNCVECMLSSASEASVACRMCVCVREREWVREGERVNGRGPYTILWFIFLPPRFYSRLIRI